MTMKKTYVFSLFIVCITTFGLTTHASATFMATATGSQQIGEAADAVNGIITDAKCVLNIGDKDSNGELPYKLQCFDTPGVVQVHLHVGPSDGTGPLAAFLFGPLEEGQDFNGIVAQDTLSEDELNELSLDELIGLFENDGIYLNVHTEGNPPGEVRGQIVDIPDANIVDEFFLTVGSGGQMRGPNPVTTDATCSASLRAKGSNLKYKVKCYNIEGITQVHLHLATAQANGPVGAFLFPFGEPTGQVNGIIRRDNGDKSAGTLKSSDLLNTIEGAPISDFIELMRTDGVYLVVHTEAEPPGEVRGQITLVGTLAGGF